MPPKVPTSIEGSSVSLDPWDVIPNVDPEQSEPINDDFNIDFFDPEGSGYDTQTADNLGELYAPDEAGHRPSIHINTGRVLKGKNHPTWNKTAKVEENLGNKIIKRANGAYYTVPKTAENNETKRNLLQSGFTLDDVSKFTGETHKATPPSRDADIITRTAWLGRDLSDTILKQYPQLATGVAVGSASWIISGIAGLFVSGIESLAESGDEFSFGEADLELRKEPEDTSTDQEKKSREAVERGKVVAEGIASLAQQATDFLVTDPHAKEQLDSIGHLMEFFLNEEPLMFDEPRYIPSLPKHVGTSVKIAVRSNPLLKGLGFNKIAPFLEYLATFSTELLMFHYATKGIKKINGKIVDINFAKDPKKMDVKIVSETGKERFIEIDKPDPAEFSSEMVNDILNDKSVVQSLSENPNDFTTVKQKQIRPEKPGKKAEESAEVLEAERAKEISSLGIKEQAKELTKEPEKKAEVSAETLKNVARRKTLTEQIDVKSEQVKRKGIKAQEKVRLQEDIDFAKREAKALGEEIAETERENIIKAKEQIEAFIKEGETEPGSFKDILRQEIEKRRIDKENAELKKELTGLSEGQIKNITEGLEAGENPLDIAKRNKVNPKAVQTVAEVFDAEPKAKVKSVPDKPFKMVKEDGEVNHVATINGKEVSVFRDPESGWWFDNTEGISSTPEGKAATGSSGFPLRGFNKTEAIEAMNVKYKAEKSPLDKAKVTKAKPSPDLVQSLERLRDVFPEDIARIEESSGIKLTAQNVAGLQEFVQVLSKVSSEPVQRVIAVDTYLKSKAKLDSFFDPKNITIRSGIDPSIIKDAVIVGAYHIETGFRDFGSWSKLMTQQFGEGITPALEKIWDTSNREYRDIILGETAGKLVKQSVNNSIENIKPEGSKVKKKKFMKTVEDSPTTDPELREAVRKVENNEYEVQTNEASLAKANKRIEESIEQAIEFVTDETTLPSAEKGATYIALMEELQNRKEWNRAADIIDSYATQLVQAGQFVQAASIWNHMTPEGFLRWAEKQIKGVNEKAGFATKQAQRLFPDYFKRAELTKADKAFILEEMTRIRSMTAGQARSNAFLNLVDFVAERAPSGASEILDAYRYQNMLSSWQTQQRNIGENVANAFLTRPVVLATQAPIDWVSGLFGKEREAYITDAPVYYKNMLNAYASGLEAFKATWRGELALDKPDIGVNVNGLFQQRRAKNLPRSVTVVQRFMEASDRFLSTMITAGEYGVNLKNGMTETAARAKAGEVATRYLYRTKRTINEIKQADLSIPAKGLAIVGNFVNELRRKPILGKTAQIAIPFIQTPINKGINMVELSALGLLRSPKELRNLSLESQARVMAGSMATAVGAYYAYNNDTTWVAPTGTDNKAYFYDSGKRPFSIKVDDKWIPMWYLGPFALAFALPTAFKFYMEDSRTAFTDDWFEKSVAVAGASARFIGSQSSTQSIGTFFNFLAGDLDYTFINQLAFTTEQIIPASGLIRTTNKLIDPYYRKPNGFLESIFKDMPGLSKNLAFHETPAGLPAQRNLSVLAPYEWGYANENSELFEYYMLKEAQEANIMNEIEQKLEKQLQTGRTNEKKLENLQQKYMDYLEDF